MKIVRVRIEGWRSIKFVEFYPSDITVLVGSNNAGKTNILTAINFILGERWPMPANLLDTDFYGGNRLNKICIDLALEHRLYSRVSFDTSRPMYALSVYDHQGSIVRGFNNARREELSFAYVDASRNFERQFSASRWSLFGQAVRRLHEDLRTSAQNHVERLRQTLDQAHDLLKTNLYTAFEGHLRDAFAAQLKTTRYDVAFEFRTLDETNLYRGLYPTIKEGAEVRGPTEVGSGVRNLLVLALFQAFARTFRGGSVIGIEEPELYLHPHAQRSLMREMEEMAKGGSQILISSHSACFLDVTRSERIVVVERCDDEDQEICTQVRTTSAGDLLSLRQALHPGRPMTTQSLRAFLRNVRTPEMTEPYFSHLVIIVEGPSEREALPLYAAYLGLDFDKYGISIVSANGKTAIDTLAHLYQAHKIKTYIIFDNDTGLDAADRAYNAVLCRLLGLPETDEPTAETAASYAILEGNWEQQCRKDILAGGDSYDGLVADAREALEIPAGRNKPLVARYVAERQVAEETIPYFAEQIISQIRNWLPPGIHEQAQATDVFK